MLELAKDLGMWVVQLVALAFLLGVLSPVLLGAMFIGFQIPNKLFGITSKSKQSMINALTKGTPNE